MFIIECEDGISNILPNKDAVIRFAEQHYADRYRSTTDKPIAEFANFQDAKRYLDSKGFVITYENK